MREIIFRAKDIRTNEWKEGSLVIRTETGDITNLNEYFILPSPGMYYIDDFDPLKIDPETICQFTGRIDINGTKIFEGDIVDATIIQNKQSSIFRFTKTYIVKYHPKHCYFYLARPGGNLLFDGNWSYGVTNLEVISNIFEIPETLKGYIKNE